LAEVSPTHVEAFARALDQTSSLDSVTGPGLSSDIADVYSRTRFLAIVAEGRTAALSPHALAIVLRSSSRAYESRGSERLEIVWTGPESDRLESRQTAAVMHQVIEAAEKHLLLISFAANDIKDITEAVRVKAQRGVTVSCIFESGSQNAHFRESAKSLASIAPSLPGVTFYGWPTESRAHPYVSLHAKVAVADDALAFVTSANLTESAIADNVEMGLLVHGGSIPRTIRSHFQSLIDSGVFRPLT
jgi:phosphatidylserine/phosphatidylglycerophosphate/cardiolipin synthase-like enzyme